MTEIQVLGVLHNIKHPDYKSLLSYIDKNISGSDRVAFESPLSLEEILKIPETNSKSPQYKFLHGFVTRLQEKGAICIPVEDMGLYRKAGKLRQYYMFDELEVLEADEEWQQVCAERTVALLPPAEGHQANYLIMGGVHAYGLSFLGYDKVHTFSQIPEAVKAQEEEWLTKFGITLNISPKIL